MMSVNASKQQLIELIHRHLKEHGFHSAADELQRQSPQNETPTSASLLDIYTSWLKSSKRKGKTVSTKHSIPDKKDKSQKKATPKKTIDKTTKQQTPNKKTTPTKRKKSGGKATEEADKSNKSNTQNKDVSVPEGGDDSDSDSSLDIEKWKKLVQKMTDTDLAKMDAINALTTPQPKKQRVRKPRTKSPAKSESQNNGLVKQSEKSEKTTEDGSAKVNKTKRSRPKKVPTVTFTIPNQDQHISSETPATSAISPSKQTPKKEKRKVVTSTNLEPEKKKKKVTIKEKVEESGNVMDGDSLITKNLEDGHPTEGELTEKVKLNSANVENEPKKKKKKEGAKEKVKKSGDDTVVNDFVDKSIDNTKEGKVEDENGNSTVEDVNANQEIESLVKVKKVKKKKKEKTKDEGDSVQTVTEADAKTETVISEETSQNTHEIFPKKKKKKKDKKKEEAEIFESVEKKNTDVTVCLEDNSEQLSTKKKSKKKKKENLEDVVSDQTREEQDRMHENGNTLKITESCDGSETPGQTPKPKKKKLSSNSVADTQLLPPPTPQTPSLSTKKKKSKLESEEITKAQSVSLQVDAASQILESETPRKKKKKSSKSSETEG